MFAPVRIVVPLPLCSERAGAADRAAERHRVRSIEGQPRLVADITGQAAARAAIADLQCAARRLSCRRCRCWFPSAPSSLADLLQRTGAADVPAYLQQPAAIDDEAAVVDDGPEPSEPVRPPLPTCSVDPSIVVPPA